VVDSGSHYVKVTSGQRSAEASGAIQVDSGDVRAVDLTLTAAAPPATSATANAAEATAQAPKATASAEPAATAAPTADSLSLDALPEDAPAAHAGRTGSASHTVGAKTTAPAPAAGKGLLNINSVPMSKILLDGRPLGQTPKTAVSVSAGPHTVVFVNPEKGRKVVTVNVRAGATSMAITRF
jgi:serine/threonine-protein kinase